jgi:hypothetical protein
LPIMAGPCQLMKPAPKSVTTMRLKSQIPGKNKRFIKRNLTQLFSYIQMRINAFIYAIKRVFNVLNLMSSNSWNSRIRTRLIIINKFDFPFEFNY